MKSSRILDGRSNVEVTSKTHLRYDTTIPKIRFNDDADRSNAYELQNTSLAPFQFVLLMLSTWEAITGRSGVANRTPS